MKEYLLVFINEVLVLLIPTTITFIGCISLLLIIGKLFKFIECNEKKKQKKKLKEKKKIINEIHKIFSINLIIVDEEVLYKKVLERNCFKRFKELQEVLNDTVLVHIANKYNLYIYRLAMIGVRTYERQAPDTTNLLVTHLNNNFTENNLNNLNEIIDILVNVDLYINSLNQDAPEYKKVLVNTIECIDLFKKSILDNNINKASLFKSNIESNIEILNNL